MKYSENKTPKTGILGSQELDTGGLTFSPLVTYEKIKSQRNKVICPGSHRWQMVLKK